MILMQEDMKLKTKNKRIDKLLSGINLANYEPISELVVKIDDLMALRNEILALRESVQYVNKEKIRLKGENSNLISKLMKVTQYPTLDTFVSKGKIIDKVSL